MRAAFVRALTAQAADDPRVVLLTADLGFMVLEPFAERFPDRFFNVGVAEQNMVGLATGLAEAGFIPFVYSIATFASMRGYEFVRNGPVLHRLPVRVVGVGGGFDYGHAGATHHAVEDIAIMRVQPGLAVVVPADGAQTQSAMDAIRELPGPVYLRLGKDEPSPVPGLDGRFALGRTQLVRRGRDIAYVALGPAAGTAVEAAALLAGEGVDAAVVVVASVSPAPVEDLAAMLADYGNVLTVEGHSVTGGLGSLVAEVVAERGLRCRVHRHGITSPFDGVSGSPAYLNHTNGLSPAGLVVSARELLAA